MYEIYEDLLIVLVNWYMLLFVKKKTYTNIPKNIQDLDQVSRKSSKFQ